MNQKTVLILANKYTTILNFRLEVVEALVKEGYRVVVSLPDHERIKEIESVGAEVIRTSFEKNGMNPIEDFSLIFTYKKIIKQTKADVVLTYTIKPNVYGGMAAASLNVPYIANITGLGNALAKEGLVQKIAILLYRRGFRKVSKVFFQNVENREFFEKKKIPVGAYELIPGSGVNMNKFIAVPYPDEKKVHFAFISRIMKEKGIEQYIEAAKIIKKEYPNTEFHVAGFGDETYEQQMKEYHEQNTITFHGLLNDVRVLVKDVHCVIHPTYYPEGMSNVLLESAASCKPIISTDRAGCREAIDDGINGYLIKEKDSQDLIEKIKQFLSLSWEEKREMGLKGREKMNREFDRNIIVKKYIESVGHLTN